ncbi:NAD(P)-binding Rossmann-fold superfamily protein [Euphorbia peplus]|nr:NAD(P)-binding Rossmann-fold superfamily protein [Euphorbia peplus]
MGETENPIHFGIMGCAKIAKKVARAINLAPNSTLNAIASRSKEKAKLFASENELDESVKLYGSYEELIEDESIDVIYMPLPTSLHVQWAVLAAQNKKHLMLEKPPALNVQELDQILEACESNDVQFMDGTMWLHHPRTFKIKDILSHPKLISTLEFIHSTCTMPTSPEFLANDIRVKPDMDGLGALGDLGWYCIGAILWSKNYKLPTSVTALPHVSKNASGVILSCSASFHYDSDKTNAIFHCSFFSYSSMDLQLVGSNGSIHVTDLFIPLQEDSALFDFTYLAKFVDLHIGWNVKPENIVVGNELPQEVLMVQELAGIVQGIKSSGACGLNKKWPEISRKTQLVLDAVKKSIDLGCVPVYL